MSEKSQKLTCGVIYVATGEKFVAEAETSLATLRQSNPGLPAVLLTDASPARADLWDEVMDAWLLCCVMNAS